MNNIKIEQLEYHRNGISGLGFHVAIAKSDDERMVVVRFEKGADKETGGIVCAAFMEELCSRRRTGAAFKPTQARKTPRP